MKLSIPETWQITKLAELAIYVLGGDWGKDADFESPDYSTALCIRGAEFRNWREDKGSSASPRKIKNSSLANRVLKDGDILVEISGGGPDQPVGRTVLIDKVALSHSPEVPKICTNFVRLLRAADEIDSRFLNSYLTFFYASGEIRDYQAGSNNLRNLKFNDYLGIDIPIPPFNEQHRIVAKIEELFSDLDKGIENLKTAQAQLKVYRQALLKHAFEGKLTAQWREERRAKSSVTPAQAGVHAIEKLDSRLRGNDEMGGQNDEPLETADDLLKRIQQARAQRYQQQLTDWQANGGSKPKAPKPLPPLTAEELAELPELPEGWGWVRLDEISENITDGDHQAPPQTKEGVPFITISDIKNQRIDFSDTRYVSQSYFDGLSVMRKPAKDDILYTVTGSFGIPSLIDFDRNFCFQRHIGLIRSCKKIAKKFLFYSLASRHVYGQAASVATGTAQKTVPLGGLRLFKIPLMSYEEQQQIENELESRLSEAVQLDQTITTSLQQAEALRQSILKKAFSGQLVPQDPHDEPASVLLTRIKAEQILHIQASKKSLARSKRNE